jgi:hypothetical protein
LVDGFTGQFMQPNGVRFVLGSKRGVFVFDVQYFGAHQRCFTSASRVRITTKGREQRNGDNAD